MDFFRRSFDKILLVRRNFFVYGVINVSYPSNSSKFDLRLTTRCAMPVVEKEKSVTVLGDKCHPRTPLFVPGVLNLGTIMAFVRNIKI